MYILHTVNDLNSRDFTWVPAETKNWVSCDTSVYFKLSLTAHLYQLDVLRQGFSNFWLHEPLLKIPDNSEPLNLLIKSPPPK